MKNTIILTLIITFFTSCNPQKRLARMQKKWCEPYEHNDTLIVHSIDTITNETIKTVMLAPNPDTLLLYAQAYCDSANNVQMDNVFVDDGKNSASISIKDNNLQARIICNEDSLKKIIHIRETKIKELENKQITKNKIRYITVDVWYKWFFWLVVLMLVVGVVVYIRLHLFKKLW